MVEPVDYGNYGVCRLENFGGAPPEGLTTMRNFASTFAVTCSSKRQIEPLSVKEIPLSVKEIPLCSPMRASTGSESVFLSG
jgi:hypothetical protein